MEKNAALVRLSKGSFQFRPAYLYYAGSLIAVDFVGVLQANTIAKFYCYLNYTYFKEIHSSQNID